VSKRALGRIHQRLLTLVPYLLVCAVATLCHAQSRDALCSHGSGSFQAEFRSGVKARLGAARTTDQGLATRACEATLNWDKQEIVVATQAPQLDLDVFGADLGIGIPVAAFQVKKSDTDCCMAYQIYSLHKPPQLLRTITGGDFFGASDSDLDGRVEIWTADTAAVDGFETLVPGELDFAPTIVLRFERGRLLDVSSEFRPYFDQEIAKLRAGLDARDLADFKSSDGKLGASASLSAQQIHHLRGVKIKALEVVWSYLYSDREPEAWQALADMWPAVDVERVRAAISHARAHGILAQVDGKSQKAPVRKNHATIFDASSRSEGNKPDVIPPQPILMRRPAPLAAEEDLADSESMLDLVIDSAGKVRSVQKAGIKTFPDMDLIEAAKEWTFIPAFKDEHPVASHLRLAVSAKR
jgi:hypothetical protein